MPRGAVGQAQLDVTGESTNWFLCVALVGLSTSMICSCCAGFALGRMTRRIVEKEVLVEKVVEKPAIQNVYVDKEKDKKDTHEASYPNNVCTRKVVQVFMAPKCECFHSSTDCRALRGARYVSSKRCCGYCEDVASVA